MIRLENVLKISLQDVLKMFWRRLEDLFTKRLEDVLARHLKNVLKTSWRRLENTLKTSCRCLEDGFGRRLGKTSCQEYIGLERDVLKTSWRRLLRSKTKYVLKTSSRCFHQDECLLGTVLQSYLISNNWKNLKASASLQLKYSTFVCR